MEQQSYRNRSRFIKDAVEHELARRRRWKAGPLGGRRRLGRGRGVNLDRGTVLLVTLDPTVGKELETWPGLIRSYTMWREEDGEPDLSQEVAERVDACQMLIAETLEERCQ